jgi:ankyrin repeat protein
MRAAFKSYTLWVASCSFLLILDSGGFLRAYCVHTESLDTAYTFLIPLSFDFENVSCKTKNMPRRSVNGDQSTRQLDESDVNFANDLVAQGLIPKSKMARVLNVISSSEGGENPLRSPSPSRKEANAASKAGNNNLPTAVMPRTWKEADKIATLKREETRKTRSRSPSQRNNSNSRPKQQTKDSESAAAVSSKPGRKKKSLYATSRGANRDASPEKTTRQQQNKSGGMSRAQRKLALREAVLRGDVCYARTLLRGDSSDVNNVEAKSMVSLLHICASEGLWEMVDLLIACSADVNHANGNGETALHWAACSDSSKVAQRLLDFGADMEKTDCSGSTALLRAAEAGSPEVLAVLLSRGGSIHAKDCDGAGCVDILELCLSEDGADTGSHEGAVAAALLVVRHLSARSGEDAIEADEGNRNSILADRLRLALERRLSAAKLASEVAEVVTAGGLSCEDVDDIPKFVAHNNPEPHSLMSISPKAIQNEFFQAMSETLEHIKTAVETISRNNSPEKQQMDDTPNNRESINDAALVESDDDYYAAAASAPSSKIEDAERRKVHVQSKDAAATGKSPSAVVAKKQPKLPAGARRGKAFILGSEVSPRRKRVVVKYLPAKHIPFLPSVESARPGDIIVGIEQCHNCEDHQWNLWHDAKKYSNMADRCLIAVVRILLENKYPVRVFALKEVPAKGRQGALEVTIALRNAEGNANKWTTHTVFSKLESSAWPSAKRVATKAKNFVKWALGQGGLCSSEEAPSTPKVLSDKDGEGGGDDVVAATTVDLESRGLGMERQFMSWLMRLSTKGDSAPPSTRPPILDLLGVCGGMNTPLELCRKRVAQKGAFVPTFMEIALGDGGADLTSSQFDKLVLEHFFVFSAIDEVDTSLLENDVPVLEKPVSRISKPVDDENREEKSGGDQLTIDVESIDHSKQGRASATVLEGMGSPIFEIIPPKVEEEVVEGGNDGASEKEKQQQEEQIASADPPLAVGTRVEGNYMGSGQWYKGVVTGVDSSTGACDIEYDDDEIELGVKRDLVREVKRLPFHLRMQAKADAEAEATRSPAASAADPELLSPVNDAEHEREEPFLQLSVSEGQ